MPGACSGGVLFGTILHVTPATTIAAPITCSRTGNCPSNEANTIVTTGIKLNMTFVCIAPISAIARVQHKYAVIVEPATTAASAANGAAVGGVEGKVKTARGDRNTAPIVTTNVVLVNVAASLRNSRGAAAV